MRDELLALAERCEAATGADRRLDAEIAALLRLEKVPSWAKTWRAPWKATDNGVVILVHDNGEGGPWITASAYTASLDAAMTLVPDGLKWMTGMAFDCGAMSVVNMMSPVRAETPALALCAAALRARAALIAETNNG